MKKVLMLLSLVVLSANMYGADSTEVIRLKKGNIYSKGKVSESIRNSISSKYIIDAEEIEKKKYTSLGEILDSLAGVAVTKEIDIRGRGIGLSNLNSRPRLFVDGILQNNSNADSFPFPPIYQINIKDIEKVEVITGGAAVLYGDGAANGVILVTTKKNKKTNGNFEYRYASFNNQLTDISLGTSIDKVTLNVSYRKNKVNGFDKTFKNNTDFASGKILYDLGNESDMSLTYNLHREKRFGKYSWHGNDNNPYDTYGKERFDREKDEIIFNYNKKINNHDLDFSSFYQDLKYIKNAYVDKIYFDKKTPSEIDKTRILYEDKKIGFKIKDKFIYGDGSSLILGAGYMSNKMIKDLKTINKQKLPNKEYKLKSSTFFSLDRRTFELYAQNNYKYKNFNFIQGFRYENINYRGPMNMYYEKLSTNETLNNWAGNLGVNYLYSDTGNIYGKYEVGLTSPSPIYKAEEYKKNSLKSEKIETFEIGWNDYLYNSLISADIYFSKSKDEIEYVEDKKDKTPYYINSGETQRYGLDLKLEQKFDKLTLKESYSYINAKVTKDSPLNWFFEGKNIGKHIPWVPTHKLNLAANYEVNKKLNLSLDVNYSSDYYLNDSNTGTKKTKGNKKDGAKILTNFRLNYEPIENLNIYVGVNNLFNKKEKTYNLHSTNSKYLSVAPERNYYAGFSYKF